MTQSAFVRGFLASTASLGAATMTSRLLVALWVIICARLLGVEEFGRFSLLLSILLTAQAIADAGLSTLVTRRVSANGLWHERRLVLSSLTLQAGLGIVAGSAVAVLMVGLIHEAPATALAAACGVTTVCTAPVAKGVLRATGRVKTEAATQTASAIALLGSSGIFLVVPASATALLMTYAVVQALTTVLLIAVATSASMWMTGEMKELQLRSTFILGLPFNVMSTASLIYLRGDVLSLGWADNDIAVGNYTAALQLYQGVWMLGSVAAVVSLPLLVRARTEVAALRLGAMANRFVGGMALLGAALGAATGLLAPRLLPVLFGSPFAASGSLLQVLAISLPFVYANFALGQVLISCDRERTTMINAIVLAAISLIAFPFSASRYGASGVSSTVVGLTIVSCAIQGNAVRRNGGLSARKHFGDCDHLSERGGAGTDAGEPRGGGIAGPPDRGGRQLV